MVQKDHHVVFLCLAFCVCLLVPFRAMAANPPDYERAKATLTRLQAEHPGANSWQACADAFRKAYDNNPKWPMRAAALFRCAIALEEKAKVTKSPADALKAASVYEQTYSQYPENALADDALFRAAVVYNELLNDRKKADRHLEHIAKRYYRADHAKIAAAYREKMNKAPAKEKVDSVPSSSALAKEKQKKESSAGDKASKKSSAGSNSMGAHALPAQLGLSVRTIIIDPGHGGHDPGAMHNDVVEKDINLDVAKRLKACLEKWKYKVLLTRSGNTWVSLPDRVKFGKRNKGDLFVSVHVNASENGESHGLETYVLDFARTSSVSRLAVVENAGSGRLGDMDKVLTEMLTGMRSAESLRLAEQIQKSTLNTVKKFGYPIHDGGVKGAPFFVLVGANIPSVLVEVGYCSYKKDAEQLKKSKYRQELARGIAEGIHSYARSLSGK